MGLRGSLPKLKLRSEPLTDLTPPEWLSEQGREFYAKHAKQLAENQMLTVQTQDSFALYCDLYARLQAFNNQPTSRTYLDTLKAFTALASKFRMVPNEKPEVKEDRFKDFATFSDE